MMRTPAANVDFSFSGGGGCKLASGFSLVELVKAKIYTKRLSELGLGVRMFLYVAQDVLLERVVWVGRGWSFHRNVEEWLKSWVY